MTKAAFSAKQMSPEDRIVGLERPPTVLAVQKRVYRDRIADVCLRAAASGPDRCDQRPDADDVHDAGQIVGKY
jgi:hypothetical protein